MASNTGPSVVFHAATSTWVALGALLILLVRKTDTFIHPQLWAEDATQFFLDADLRGAAVFMSPFGGYLHTVPRLFAFLGSLLDPAHVPGFYVLSATAVAVVCVIHMMSPRMALPWRPVLALIPVLVPHTGEVYLNLANTNCFAALILVQFAFKQDWTNARQRAVDASLLVLCGLSGPASILVLPAIAWRAWRRRSGPSRGVFAIVAGCALVQLAFLAQEPIALHARGAEPVAWSNMADVLAHRWIFGVLSNAQVPAAVPPSIIAAAAFGVVGILLFFALRRADMRDAKWILAGTAVIFLVAAVLRVRLGLMDAEDIANDDRYYFVPKVLLAWWIAVEAAERLRFAWIWRVALILAFALSLPGFRFAPAPDLRWHQYCDAIRRGEKIDVPVLPAGRMLYYPGRNPTPLP